MARVIFDPPVEKVGFWANFGSLRFFSLFRLGAEKTSAIWRPSEPPLPDTVSVEAKPGHGNGAGVGVRGLIQ